MDLPHLRVVSFCKSSKAVLPIQTALRPLSVRALFWTAVARRHRPNSNESTSLHSCCSSISTTDIHQRDTYQKITSNFSSQTSFSTQFSCLNFTISLLSYVFALFSAPSEIFTSFLLEDWPYSHRLLVSTAHLTRTLCRPTWLLCEIESNSFRSSRCLIAASISFASISIPRILFGRKYIAMNLH